MRVDIYFYKDVIMKTTLRYFGISMGLAGSLAATTCLAGEKPIGDSVERFGMELAAVYLQPVMMEPTHNGMDHKLMDIHLEADIHALKGNKNGFGEGEWIPYMQITYQLTKTGSTWTKSGAFMPMIASDGPHYGDNLKLSGPGKYHLTYYINSPSYGGLYRHIDKEAGVGKWWPAFSLEWDFYYAGAGKKGGY